MSVPSRRLNSTLSHLSQSLDVSLAPTSGVQGNGAGGAKNPVKVLVTGAAGNIAYALVFQIGAGELLGPDQPIELRLLDLPVMDEKMKGVEMELVDCAFPLITKIVRTTDYAVAFKDLDIALLVGAKPRGPGMQRSDLLSQNAKIFSGQGKALDKYANKNCKVVVVGNPANTNCMIAMQNAPSIPRENFTALTRLDMNRALGQVSLKTGVPVKDIDNLIIWGNHSKTQYPDVNHAIIRNGNDTLPLRSVINDDSWVQGPFLTTVQDRGAAIIAARKLSSAASAANATIEHIHDWILGTRPGSWVSMAVPSDGSYGIPQGIVYSFPVTCFRGQWKIVQGLQIDEFSRQKMQASAKELLEEKSMALSL